MAGAAAFGAAGAVRTSTLQQPQATVVARVLHTPSPGQMPSTSALATGPRLAAGSASSIGVTRAARPAAARPCAAAGAAAPLTSPPCVAPAVVGTLQQQRAGVNGGGSRIGPDQLRDLMREAGCQQTSLHTRQTHRFPPLACDNLAHLRPAAIRQPRAHCRQVPGSMQRAQLPSVEHGRQLLAGGVLP